MWTSYNGGTGYSTILQAYTNTEWRPLIMVLALHCMAISKHCQHSTASEPSSHAAAPHTRQRRPYLELGQQWLRGVQELLAITAGSVVLSKISLRTDEQHRDVLLPAKLVRGIPQQRQAGHTPHATQ